MNHTDEESKRTEFKNILFDLAKDQEILQDSNKRFQFYLRFEKLYDSKPPEKNFRHYYSDIFIVLTQIENGDAKGSRDVLGQNLLEIRKGYQAINYDGDRLIDIASSLKKLYDHVSLEIAHLSYNDKMDREALSIDQVNAIEGKIAFLEDAKSNLENSHKRIEDKIDNSQKEYIAILGIFAAVVLTFIAGIAFSTSVLQNINNVSIYRIVLIVLLIGLVLTNVLYGLFCTIERLIGKKDSHSIKSLLIADGIFIVCILLTILLWSNGIAEKRNERIFSEISSRVSQVVSKK